MHTENPGNENNVHPPLECLIFPQSRSWDFQQGTLKVGRSSGSCMNWAHPSYQERRRYHIQASNHSEWWQNFSVSKQGISFQKITCRQSAHCLQEIRGEWWEGRWHEMSRGRGISDKKEAFPFRVRQTRNKHHKKSLIVRRYRISIWSDK